MQLSVLRAAVQAVDEELDVDFNLMSGADAASLAEVLAPFKHRIDAALLNASARAVEANQHNVDGARSGAAWVAKRVGASEQYVRSQLALHTQLQAQPDVQHALQSGGISVEETAAIIQGANGKLSVANELLLEAKTGTVESIRRRAQEIRSRQADHGGHRRERLRQSQFINVRTDADAMVCAELRLLPEIGAALLEADRKAMAHSSWERAELWASLLTQQNGQGPQLVFHLDVSTDVSGVLDVGERCELKGVGPVPVSTVVGVMEQASRTLVGTVNNKLDWFSEQDRRSSTKPLPEYIKRAIRAKAYDQCEKSDCSDCASDVDHNTARCNDGSNDFENLRALCRPDHDAKTRKDAPWTAGGIYKKIKTNSPPGDDRDCRPCGGGLFVDTS